MADKSKFETLKKLTEEMERAEKAEELLSELWAHIGPYGLPSEVITALPTDDAARKKHLRIVELMLPLNYMQKLQKHFNFDDSE